MFKRRPAFERILKNFEAEGRIDSKNKKQQVHASADVLFLPQKIGEEQKKVYKAAHVLFFTDIQCRAIKKELRLNSR